MSADHDETGRSVIEPVESDQSGSGPVGASQEGNGQNGANAAGGSPDGASAAGGSPGGASPASGSPGSAGSGSGDAGSGGSGGGKPGTPAAALGRAAMITAIALIVVYIAMLFILMSMRNDKEWDRLVYLLSGFEALVFAGAGALFGTTIQRANVTAARNDAAEAKKDAAGARQTAKAESDRAQKAEKNAAAGRFLAAAVTTKANTRASRAPDLAADGAGLRGSRPETVMEAGEAERTGLDADLAELSALARTIMPD